MKKSIFLLPENRVRRNYIGGAALDMFRRKSMCADGDMPEDWIASSVAATNPGLPPVENEGISYIYDKYGKKQLFPGVLAEDPIFYLGESHYRQYGFNTGFLAKLLDSSIRLHVQVHPTREYARKHLNSRWGKLECYYILGSRPGFEPYIRLGFQNAPSRDEWRRIIENQDMEAMDACFEKVPVKPGEVWLVPGGLPHAIGEGLLMIEVMEPTDLVVRCEFERDGIIVPPGARFMGRGLDFALDIFDYKTYSVEEITQMYRINPVIINENANFSHEKLISSKMTGSFEIERLYVEKEAIIETDNRFYIGIVCKGPVELNCREETLQLAPGDCFFAAASCIDIKYKAIKNTRAEICIIRPG